MTDEAVTAGGVAGTNSSNLNLTPYNATFAHKAIPPEWLHQEGHPCSVSGRIGTMQLVDGKLVCVIGPPKESKERVMARSVVRDLVRHRLASSSC